MTIIKALFAGLAAVWIGSAQNIAINGIVTDTEDSPIAGAVVQLENNGLSATTNTDGTFTITDAVSSNTLITMSIPHTLSVKIHGDLLCITAAEKYPVEIGMYTLQGEVISTIKKIVGVGTHSIPLSRIGAGIYLYKIKTGTNERVIKNICRNHTFGGSVFGNDGLTATSSLSLSKRYVTDDDAVTDDTVNTDDDVIAVAKDGYLNYRILIANLDTSNIEIKLIVCADTVTDIDGNVYQAVQIGKQIWTVQDLRVTHYNDGSAIPKWGNRYVQTPAYCFFKNDSATYAVTYGALYNAHAVNTGKLAPKGWHIPTIKEWDALSNYLIANGYNWDGTTDSNKTAKSMAAQADWNSDGTIGAPGNDVQSNNSTGFSGMPSGFRDHNNECFSIGNQVFWWSSTKNGGMMQYHYAIYNQLMELIRFDNALTGYGFSVRLLRD